MASMTLIDFRFLRTDLRREVAEEPFEPRTLHSTLEITTFIRPAAIYMH